MRNYGFRPITADDLPLLSNWLNLAHVRAWWGDADRQLALIKQDMNNDQIDMRLVELVGRPFAYIHDHDVHAFQMPHFADLPPGTRAVDTFVGDVAYQGQGHAAGYIDARLRDLRLSYPMAAVAPSTTDTRTIAIYAQAGFRKRRLASTRDGKLVQVMTHL
ncbi:GNAT family N-acetyltransferase [Yoonia sp. SS1-5]|uniref:GNAT family N-acetyltransferase n=1 Tax=Yoonia rhodophyticola TaxID=3137370 RepID=A0AAN0MJX6_9RHOB